MGLYIVSKPLPLPVLIRFTPLPTSMYAFVCMCVRCDVMCAAKMTHLSAVHSCQDGTFFGRNVHSYTVCASLVFVCVCVYV